MNARINREGRLIIEAMNEQESYLLQMWLNDNLHIDDQGNASYRVNCLEVKMDDE